MAIQKKYEHDFKPVIKFLPLHDVLTRPCTEKSSLSLVDLKVNTLMEAHHF